MTEILGHGVHACTSSLLRHLFALDGGLELMAVKFLRDKNASMFSSALALSAMYARLAALAEACTGNKQSAKVAGGSGDKHYQP